MASEPTIGDAFGAALLAHFHDTVPAGMYTAASTGWHVIERDDGHVRPVPSTPYFAHPEDWSSVERQALDQAVGRVLDVGVGAGRFCLALADRGHETLGVDPSAGAIEVCRQRGLDDLHLGTIFDLPDDARPFDTVLLAGNNVGLLESASHAPGFLARLRALVETGSVLLGLGLDPYLTDDPQHLAYHERNRRRGRLPGQLRLRVRFEHLATDWWDYLLVDPDQELPGLVEGSGWAVTDLHREDPVYLVTLAAT